MPHRIVQEIGAGVCVIRRADQEDFMGSSIGAVVSLTQVLRLVFINETALPSLRRPYVLASDAMKR